MKKNIFTRFRNGLVASSAKRLSASFFCAALLFGFASCSNGLGINESESGIAARAASDLTGVIAYGAVPSTVDPVYFYAWDGLSGYSWPGEKMEKSDKTLTIGSTEYTWWYIQCDVPSKALNVIYNAGSNAGQTEDIKNVDYSSGSFYYVVDTQGSGKWTAKVATEEQIATAPAGISVEETVKSAEITDAEGETVKVKISGFSDITKDVVSVTDSAGTSLTVSDVSFTTSLLTVKLSSGDLTKTPYTVKIKDQSVKATIAISLVESEFGVPATNSTDKLGLTLSETTATFRTWAPTATKAEVLLYASASDAYDISKTKDADSISTTTREWGTAPTDDAVKEMIFDSSTGIWTASNVNVSGYKYYKYRLTISGVEYYVSDIWHTVASGDSIASQLVSIDDSSAKPANWENAYTNPFGKNGTETKKYNDAVIYEMHIRDWSRAFKKDSTGKFLDIADNLGSSGEFAKHLKDLGVTHVQILPMFDYAQVNSDKNYNWGYNPYHYNVPEGRYVTDGYTDGTQAVKEMRQMVQAFHEAGIAVIMDVVYNHTAAIGGGSLYDSTVPGYFYRQDSNGNYSNGSGVGPDTASDRSMVHKYFLESIVHWVKDYHINGFRFDLMGVHDTDFMKDVYDALYDIDKNILVYGEPWTGGDIGTMASGKTQATAAGTATKGYGYGAFDDDFRDAIKGVDSFSFGLGHVQGKYEDSTIVDGLLGKVLKNKRNPTGNTGLAIHYAECHDNYTLFDKLVYSTIPGTISKDHDAPKFAAAYNSVMSDSAKLEEIKKEDTLAAAYVILSQGTPFINGGQEFMRTKKGNPDSYSADEPKGGIAWTNEHGEYNIDDVNTIDLSMKETYFDVYTVYRGLIALRSDYSAFRGYGTSAAEKLAAGVTKYTVSADDGNFTVVFNATDNDAAVEAVSGNIVDVNARAKVSGKYFGLGFGDVDVDVDVEPYRIYNDASSVASVPAKSFVIVKTN